jgi:heme/copper-type cytochrome/quinol oxidase subunit 3
MPEGDFVFLIEELVIFGSLFWLLGKTFAWANKKWPPEFAIEGISAKSASSKERGRRPHERI